MNHQLITCGPSVALNRRDCPPWRKPQAAAPAASSWATAEFATLRPRLIKVAVRVSEGAARIRIRLPSACPDKALFRLLAGRFAAAAGP